MGQHLLRNLQLLIECACDQQISTVTGADEFTPIKNGLLAATQLSMWQEVSAGHTPMELNHISPKSDFESVANQA